MMFKTLTIFLVLFKQSNLIDNDFHYNLVQLLRQGSDKQLYVSPWTKFETYHPQILNFKPNGEVERVKLSLMQIVNYINLRPLHAKQVNGTEGSKLKFATVLKNMRKHIMEKMNKKLQTSSKIMVYCDKGRTVCRFLVCDQSKKLCILCEVVLDSTDCSEHDITWLLKGQRIF